MLQSSCIYRPSNQKTEKAQLRRYTVLFRFFLVIFLFHAEMCMGYFRTMCAWESETVFPTLTDIFQSPLIHISVSWPVMSIILLQICRVACLPFLWLQETAPQWDAHPAAEAAMSHTSHTWPCFLFTLHVSRQAPPLLHLPNLGTTTWWTPLAFCSDQLTIKKNQHHDHLSWGKMLLSPKPTFSLKSVLSCQFLSSALDVDTSRILQLILLCLFDNSFQISKTKHI